jgi:hypothetical protein
MKKSLVVFCGVALALAAFAEPKAATPGKGGRAAPNARPGGMPQMPQMQNGGFPMPTMFTINSSTTAQQVKDFKKQICDKVDAAFKARSAKTGEEKQPATIIFFVNEGGFNFGGMGMGQGFGGAGGMPQMPVAPAQ